MVRAVGAVGSASHRHCGGRWFESSTAHHLQSRIGCSSVRTRTTRRKALFGSSEERAEGGADFAYGFAI